MPYSAIVISGNTHPHRVLKQGALRRGDTDTLIKGWREARTIRWQEIGGAEEWNQIIPFLHARANIVENNEIHHVVERLSDGNGILLFCAGPFNIIRSNYLHHIFRGAGAIRLDGWQRDTLVTENIIYDSPTGGISRKNYNHVENNIVVDVKNKPRHGYINFFSFPEDTPTTGSRVQRNIFYHPGKDPSFYSVWDWTSRDRFTKPQDCYADYNLFYCAGDPQAGDQFIQAMRAGGIEEHSISADPLFVDLKNGDFRLRPDSPALKLGFKSIDVSRIGLTKDFPQRFRKSGPDAGAIRSASTP